MATNRQGKAGKLGVRGRFLRSQAGSSIRDIERSSDDSREGPMPTLIRFLVFCAVVAGIVYGGMFALTLYVKPRPREITVRVPTDKLNPPQDTAQQSQ